MATLLVSIRNVYGNETIYPENDAARAIARIAGTRTLTRRALEAAQQLGFTVQLDTSKLPALFNTIG